MVPLTTAKIVKKTEKNIFEGIKIEHPPKKHDFPMTKKRFRAPLPSRNFLILQGIITTWNFH